MRILFILLAVAFLSGCAEENVEGVQYKAGDFWVSNFRSNSYPSKALHNNKIYCSSLEIGSGKPNYLYCLNAETGKVDWATQVDNWASAPPVVTDSFIYYCSFVGDIYKLNKDGRQLWKTKLQTGSYAGHYMNPYNNNLLVHTVENGIVELHGANGKEVHHYGKWTLATTNPVFDKGKMYVGGVKEDTVTVAEGTYLYCYDATNGNTLWKDSTGEIAHNLFVHEGKLYFARPAGELVCFDPLQRKTVWQTGTTTPGGAKSTLDPCLAFLNGAIFYYDLNLDVVRELDMATGRQVSVASYKKLVQQGKMKPHATLYTLSRNDTTYRVTVTDSLEAPVQYGSAYNVYIKR
jgi:outer membrane protein assembly factor BamB